MKRSFVALSLILLASCAPAVQSSQPITLSSDQVSRAQDAVARDMRNPSAAQFRDLRGANYTLEDGATGVSVCGSVNGQNGFGGMTGFVPFIVNFRGSQMVGLLVTDPTSEFSAAIVVGQCNRIGL